MSTKPNKNRKRSVSERLQGYSPIFPEVEQPAPPLIPEQLDQLQEPPVAIPVDYPRLRTILRDRGLTFQPIFGQRDVARILGKSDKTVRAWTSMSKLPCCWWPSGDPYYTPRNIEDFLTRCEHGGKATK